MARADYPADRRAGRPAGVLASRRVVGSGLLAVLGVVVLGTAAGGPEWIRSWLIASVLVAFAGVLIVARYWAATTSSDVAKPYLVDYQLVLLVGLLGILYQSRTPGYGLGIHRGLETAAVFTALVAFCVLAGDPRRHDPFQWLVLGCFAVVAGIFFYHGVSVAEVSARSRHPVWWGVTAGVCLAVLPQYVSREAFLWAVSRLAAGVVLIALPVYVLGEYSVYGLQVGFMGEFTVPIVDYEVRATRSLFVNRNAFATVVFAGLVAALAELHRSLIDERSVSRVVLPSVLLAVNAFGLAIAYGRALWVVTPIALVIFGTAIFVRRLVPIAVFGGVAYLLAGIYAVHSGLIPLPEGTPTRGNKWYPAVAVIREHWTWLGEGLIASGNFIAEHNNQYNSGSPHNSYISILVRTGLVGGIAYLCLVGVSLLRGLWRYRTVNVAVLGLAVGYAAHQGFESYTLINTFPSSVVVALVFGMLVFGSGVVDGSTSGDSGVPAPRCNGSDDRNPELPASNSSRT